MSTNGDFRCGEALALSGALVDRELSPQTSLRLLLHAFECERCQREVADLARLKCAVSGAVRRTQPPADWQHRMRRYTC